MRPLIELPAPARIVERLQETETIFTLRLRLEDAALAAQYRFAPGQFNMLYLPGVGEVPISIVSDARADLIDHTIRAVGSVTQALARLPAGAVIGLRGPFGRGWPMQAAEGRDLFIVTGGLGCAPSVSAVHAVLARRERYGRVVLLEGVRHCRDLALKSRFAEWLDHPDLEVRLAVCETNPCADWPWHTGNVLTLFDALELKPERTIAFLCGPEGMMQAAAEKVAQRGVQTSDIYLSLERNMQCALGLCGHCQLGPHFVCREGPVFDYATIGPLLGKRGV
ncbi:NAD(P)H-flavin reductase [Sulfuritortus calidifontis]|uniref:NAD(P)H-flavin reductase n=1 Tax=Sulfuritortus calidifontis TaxID=1914471 RepID=A0A4R3JXX2_9PROT|nr:FAD/NAD(P)-binding protein [Sulfuritortus calidifontis]TCS73283.1 NAD(P)H-flavin reductase [Sulfuritortus calidifontis]